MSASMHRAKETILITGFPSALSTALCRELLTDDHENTSILLLVTRDLESAAKAFRGAFAKKRKARLTILVGDPLTASLDLSGLALRQVLETLTIIIHAENICDDAYQSKINRLHQLLKLARRAPKFKRFCLTSSITVNRNLERKITEEELAQPTGEAPHSDLMARTELIIREVMVQIPCTVFRLSAMVGGFSEQDFSGLGRGVNATLANLVWSSSQLPMLVPQIRNMPFNVVPLDYAVRAMIHLSGHPASLNRTFHITDPNPMTMESAIALFADLTNRQRPLFYGRLFERSIRLLRQSVFRRLIPIRTIEHAKTIFASSYDCAGTLELLKDTQILCPSFDEYADELATWLAIVERETIRPTSNE